MNFAFVKIPHKWGQLFCVSAPIKTPLGPEGSNTLTLIDRFIKSVTALLIISYIATYDLILTMYKNFLTFFVQVLKNMVFKNKHCIDQQIKQE